MLKKRKAKKWDNVSLFLTVMLAEGPVAERRTPTAISVMSTSKNWMLLLMNGFARFVELIRLILSGIRRVVRHPKTKGGGKK